MATFTYDRGVPVVPTVVIEGHAFNEGDSITTDDAGLATKLRNHPGFTEVGAFNGADPAKFDHDGDGKPGGSKPKRRRK